SPGIHPRPLPRRPTRRPGGNPNLARESALFAPGGRPAPVPLRPPIQLALVFDLPWIHDPAAPFRRRRILQIADEIADVLLELGERSERIDLEHGHKATVIVTAGRLDAKTETGQQPAQNLDHNGKPGPLVAAIGAAERQSRAA